MNISLVIPVKNEAATIGELIESIFRQDLRPGEIIITDGGSTDDTVRILNEFCVKYPALKVIEAGAAMPGRGRNIGAAAASGNWLAFTDAGIQLQKNWLSNLVQVATENPQTDIVYGNYHPVTDNFFERCATMAYVGPVTSGKIRSKFIASSLLRKAVWEEAGGFPDWRAAEDLIFMEKAEQLGFKIAYAPNANVYWQLRPDIASTFKRFDLYSKYNVWANRQKYWHYGVARQYLLLLPFIAAGIFHSWYWLLALPAWIIARAAKRIWMHRQQFGVKTLFNPAVIFMVSLILLVIDAATYSGWVKALVNKNPVREDGNS